MSKRAGLMTLALITGALALSACGRTRGLPMPDDSGVQNPNPESGIPDLYWPYDARPPIPDTWNPPPDGIVPWPDGNDHKPDHWLPPTDLGPLPDLPVFPDEGIHDVLPPLPDGFVWPDFGPTPDGAPHGDIWPSPDKGPKPDHIVLPPDSALKPDATHADGGGSVYPDLTITAFTASVSKNTVTYSLTVCNKGTKAAGGFYLDLYYDRSSAPGQKVYGDQSMQISSLAVSACVSETFTRKNTPAGTYSSYAQADPDNYVSESNETNNVSGPLKVKVTGSPPKGPDLTITTMTATVLGTITPIVRYRFTICNQGSQASSATVVHVYYNPSTAPTQGVKGDASSSVAALASGACTTRDIYRYNPANGTYASYGQIDPLNVVTEIDETNNVYGPVTFSIGTSTGADLTISSFSYQSYPLNTVLYVAKVCNIGTGSSGSTQLHVYYNRSTAPSAGLNGNGIAVVPILQAGTCTNSYVSRINTTTGTYTSWAYVDPLGQITETDETNNVAGPLTVTVGGSSGKPDLYISSFTGTTSGSSVVYTAQVCNKGTGMATPFRVDIYYNQSSAPTAGTSGNTYAYVPYLTGGSCTTVTRTRQNVATGSYSSWAQVDTQSWVSESDETNNVYGPITVTMGSLQGCAQLCIFSIGCGLFTLGELPTCLSWCQGLSSTDRACADSARKAASCSALKACSLPAPPAPPPTILQCASSCSWLTNTCKIIPSGQYLTCVTGCVGLSASQYSCLSTAQKNSQCLQGLICML
jgi:subtilase family serine protease